LEIVSLRKDLHHAGSGDFTENGCHPEKASLHAQTRMAVRFVLVYHCGKMGV